MRPIGLLRWAVRDSGRGLVASGIGGLGYQAGLILLPWCLGRALDDGITTGNTSSLLMWAGATLAVASKGVLMLKEPWLRFIGVERSFGVPNVIFATALIAIAAGVLMRRTRFGLRTYALGSDPAAASP